MRSLFWKIFLWFWLAIILVGATIIASVAITQSESQENRIRLLVRSWAPLQAQHAVSLYELGGPQKLAEYLHELEEVSGMDAGLYGADGKNVLNGSSAGSSAPLVEQAFGSFEAQFGAGHIAKSVAQSATGPGGHKYVFLSERRRPPFLEFLRAAPRTQLLRVIALLTVAASVCFWLAHYITAPLLRLQNAAQQIAAGRLNTRIQSELGRRRDEIADLGRDFDLMAERIETLMTSQRRLLQAISHELRSPLARLSVALGIARQKNGADLHSTLDRIERETERINHMISQLLTLTRLESGEPGQSSSLVELSLLLADVVADADFEARGRNRSVVVLRTASCLVSGDGPLLRSAIENVVRNAVRYTRENSAVETALSTERINEQTFAVLSVADQGPGVPPEALKDIFRPFYRVADARERDTGGAGLGLAITDHAVRLYGGTVHAYNAPDAGLVIELRLPVFPAGSASLKSASENTLAASDKLTA